MTEEGLDVIKFVSDNLVNLVHIHLSEPNFSCEPSKLPLYIDVVSVLRNSPVDVVLEVQKLGNSTEQELVLICEKLSEACIT
jgi:hypothetical protein